jgi:hypothetical protein
MTRFAVSQARCGTQVHIPRTKRSSANSFGLTSFAGCMRAKDVEDDFDSALKAAIVLSRRVAAGDLRVGGTR